MIEISIKKNGLLEVRAAPGSPAEEWIAALSSDKFFSAPESELAIAQRPSECEEINEDWDQYALPEILESANAWRSRFASSAKVLRFGIADRMEFAGFLNRARLKIAMEGTGDVLPPSSDSPRRSQYEFLTAFMEWVLSLPDELDRTS
jgi:hypothetical protein